MMKRKHRAMSKATRTSKTWGIVLAATLALSGFGTAFATEQQAAAVQGDVPPATLEMGPQDTTAQNQNAGDTETSEPGTRPQTQGPQANADSDVATRDSLDSGENLARGTMESQGSFQDIDVFSLENEQGEEVPAPSIAGAAASKAAKAGNVTITKESDLNGLFPDPTFRKIVFEAVRDGKKKAVGTDVKDALRNFTGNIYASSREQMEYESLKTIPGHGMAKIVDVHGMELLRNAGVVNFSFNSVEDLSWLERQDEDTDEGNLWYEGQADKGLFPHNVTWILAGNPLKSIPEYFGGRLVIEQPASDFSGYPEENVEIQSYIREDAPLSGTLHVGMVRYRDHTEYVEVDKKKNSIKDETTSNPLTIDRNQLKPDNSTIPFSGLVKSGRHTIIVGTEAIFNYGTEADLGGMWAVTPGSQSFKYTVEPVFYVYDKVKLVQNAPKIEVSLTKTDEADGTPLAGAEYSVYKDGTSKPILTGLKTDSDGRLSTPGLAPGSYRFVETKAPEGYLINPEPVAFVIEGAHTTLSGGKTIVRGLNNSVDLVAGENERFIAGPSELGGSPDIELTLNDPSLADEIEKVVVNYTELTKADGSVQTNVSSEFIGTAALAHAQADINGKKDTNDITGDVNIEVVYKQTGDAPVAAAAVSHTDKKKPEGVEYVDITGTKTWVDNDGWAGVRPETTIHLLRDGVDTGRSVTLESSSPDESVAVDKGLHYVPNYGTLNYMFADLEKYNPATGKEYVYTVREDKVTITDPVTGNTDSYVPSYTGCDVTNTWPDGTLVNIEGQKKWDDADDAAGIRPASVTIQLWQSDGTTDKLYSEHAVAGPDWSYFFELVPKFVDKEETQPYTYTIKEVPVEGYAKPSPLTVAIDGVADKQTASGNDITNKLEPDPHDPGNPKTPGDPESQPPSGKKVPATGDSASVAFVLSLLALSGVVAGAAYRRRRAS